jgi:hypothetical protein
MDLMKHGEQNMASQKIELLTDNDLDYMERLLDKEFTKQCEYPSLHRSQAHDNNTRTIARIRNAIRSERQYRLATNTKW